ncbi:MULTISPECIES: LLM class flavin-dependent oxidoreductase [unclassified Nocardiopsis]|uniref:LLM class flavin-dependent oxidoreductase n=1 Tax=unclassified Nocardiopsis TaxID=2649073 RepID=UPI0013580591|nr:MULTISPECIES: LLM class flavin-dependent oxidoreductase [unclassified Nocardiopsis]
MTRDFLVYGTALYPKAAPEKVRSLLPKIVGYAEKHGFDGLLSFYNHHDLDPWMVGGNILTHSSTVSPLIALQPYSVPPFTAAKMIHSLTFLHQRRVDVNLITGAADHELVEVGDALGHDDRYERAAEYISVVRSLLSSEQPLSHSGRYYDLQGINTNSFIPAPLRPRVFMAGSSAANRKTADSVADFAITHPEPVSMFADTFADRSGTKVGIGVRLGIIARTSSKEAWSVARSQFVPNRETRLKARIRRRSSSDWSRRIANLATDSEVYDGVYWTGAYLSDKGSMPILVGSYEEVSDYLARYLDVGVGALLLGGVFSREDFHHAGVVLDRVRSRKVA